LLDVKGLAQYARRSATDQVIGALAQTKAGADGHAHFRIDFRPLFAVDCFSDPRHPGDLDGRGRRLEGSAQAEPSNMEAAAAQGRGLFPIRCLGSSMRHHTSLLPTARDETSL